MPDFASASLIAIVTASVFTITLHAQRIREDSARSLHISSDLDRRIRQVNYGHEEYTEELWDTNNELRLTLSDRRSILVFALNLTLLVLTIALALVYGALQSRSGSLDVANVWALRSFVVVELLVVGLGAFDWWSVGNERRRRMLSSPGGLVALSEISLVMAFTRRFRTRWTRVRLHYATTAQRYARKAAALGRQRYPPSLALLGMAELLIGSLKREGQSLSPLKHLQAASTQGAKDEVVTTALAVAQWQDLRDAGAPETLLEAVRANPFALSAASTPDLTMVAPRDLRLDEHGIRSFPRTIFWELTLWLQAFEAAYDKREWGTAGDLLSDIALEVRRGEGLAMLANRLLSKVETDDSLGVVDKSSLGLDIAQKLQLAAGHDEELEKIASSGVERFLKSWLALTPEDWKQWGDGIERRQSTA
jgi:hypothetical protein